MKRERTVNNRIKYRMTRRKRKQSTSLITNIVFCMIALIALTGCIVLLLQNYMLQSESAQAMAEFDEYKAMKEECIYTQADLEAYITEAVNNADEEGQAQVLQTLRTRMQNGESTAEVLRDLFTEDVVVYSDGKYNFFPITDTLKQHDYVYDNFKVMENNQIVYVDDTNEILSKKGIDVSRYQETIDWKDVAADGVEYAFIRAGVRGTTEGKIQEDIYFEDNIEGALSNDIEVGVYFFSQAVTPKEAVEEAEFVLELIDGYDVNYPIVYDIEEVTSENARTNELTQEEYTENCIAFCETIEAAGYTPMIYGNLKSFMIMLDMTKLEEYEKWFAYYDEEVYFPYEFSIWQYTSKGVVDGIKGDVDLNVCMKNFGEQ